MNKNSFGCTLSSDFFKIKKLKSVWIALIIMFTLVLISYAAYWIGANYVENSDFGGEEVAKQEANLLLSQLKNSLLFGAASTVRIELFIAIIVCIFIGKDFSCGFVSILTARGTKKADSYFSKWISLVSLFTAFLCFAFILNGIFFALDGNGALNGDEIGRLFRNFGLQLLCGIASVSIFTMIAFLARSTGSSIAVCVGAYVVLAVLISIITTVLAYEGKTDSSTWAYYMPLQQMTVACSYDKLDNAQLVAVTVMPIVYTAVSTVIGYFTFDARDIK